MCAKPFRILLVLALVLGTAGVATAKKLTKKEIAAARKAFRTGQAALQAQNYVDAIVQFKKAFEITEDPIVMGQVMVAYEKGGDYEKALESAQVYLKGLKKRADRAPVEKRIAKFKALIKAGKSKRLYLPGEQPPPPPPPKEPLKKESFDSGDDKPPAPVKKKKGRFWTWVALGGAAALAVSALVVGLSAQSKFDELEDTCAPTCGDSDVDSVRTRAIAADVLWGTAAAAAITAGVLFFVEGSSGKESPKDKDDVEEEELEDDLVKRLRVNPLVGAGTFGLGATLRY